MINKKHQTTLVVSAHVTLPNQVSFGSCKELECLRRQEVLEEETDERGEILKRPVKWTIEKLGDELFSCVSFLVSREEIQKVFGLDDEGLFNPDETEKELKIEVPVPSGASESQVYTLGAMGEIAFAKKLGYIIAVPFSKN